MPSFRMAAETGAPLERTWDSTLSSEAPSATSKPWSSPSTVSEKWPAETTASEAKPPERHLACRARVSTWISKEPATAPVPRATV